MKGFKKVIKYTSFSYLLYIFIFSFLIFNFPPRLNEETTEEDPTEKIGIRSNQHQAALIEKAEEAISVRLDLIENARSQIDLAYYRWADGKVSDLMLGSVLEAADRGVEVRILLDGIVQLSNMNQAINDVFLGFTNHPNIEIRLYEPFNPLVPIAWNHRMHDKMMLVDQEFSLIGGRNIQDRFYLEDADPKGLVQDREALIYTPDQAAHTVIDQAGNYYDQLWNYEQTQEKFKRMSKRRIKKGEQSLDALRASHFKRKEAFLAEYFPDLESKDWKEETVETDSVQFTANSFGRMNQEPKAAKTLLGLAEEAEESIFIQSPYFIPSKRMMAEVENYDVKEARTTLFTNAKAASPNILAMAAYKNHRPKLVDSGARIVEYQGPGSTHAKSSIFDEEISVIGTFNMDPRSTYINTESMVIIDSEAFAEELKGAIAQDFERSLEVDADDNYVETEGLEASPLSLPRRILIRLLSFLTPIFEALL